MTYSVSIKLYPNNEVRATIQREVSRCYRDKPQGRDVDSVGDVGPGDLDSGRPEPLDITSKLSGGVPGFGGIPRPTKFGNNARRTISRASGVFERDGIFPDELIFLTGTIPGGTPAAFESVARWSSWIVKSIKTWISDAGCRSAYSLYVWEFQSRGALHIHYCLHCPDVMLKVELLRKWKQRWTEIIDEVCLKSGIDCWERKRGGTWATNKAVIQADSQVVRRSVGQYLASYLSKNAPENAGKQGKKSLFHGPVRWWGVSRPLLKRLDELTEGFKVEAISHADVGRVTRQVYGIMDWSENKIHSYWDMARSTNVLLTYSPKECQAIYSYLWRDVGKARCANSQKSKPQSKMICTEADFDAFLKQEKDLLLRTRGTKVQGKSYPSSPTCLSEMPVDSSVQLSLPWASAA